MVQIDMKKPAKCGECRFATALDCVADGKFIPNHKEIAPHCPLKEVEIKKSKDVTK